MNKWILTFENELWNVYAYEQFTTNIENTEIIGYVKGDYLEFVKSKYQTEGRVLILPVTETTGDFKNFVEFIKSDAVLYDAENEYSWKEDL